MSFESVDARRRRTTAYPINPPELGSGELKKNKQKNKTKKTHTHTQKHTKPDSADMVYISRLVSAFYSIIIVSEKITFILLFVYFIIFLLFSFFFFFLHFVFRGNQYKKAEGLKSYGR